LVNEEPIKVQLVKNNNNKKIYSTKTIDIKTLYNNQMNINIKNNDNDDMNKNITNKRKMSSTDLQKINFKNPTEFKDYNNQQDNSNNANNDKNFNKGIKTQYKYSSNINSPRVISAFNSYNSNNIVEDNQSKHKIHDLLSHKFLYNKPKTSSNLNNLKKNPYPYDLKTYYNNNYNNVNLNNIDNISVNSFNMNNMNRKEKMRLNKDNLSAISSDDAYTLIKNYNYYNNININNNVGINIKLDDLIICDEKLNDILIALNNNNKNYEMDASNECAEFYVFYFHSTLQNIFHKFYNEKKKIIIDSANNLTLLSIIITYHLSLNKDILKDVINIIINILKLLKINLYLNVKKIQIFFGNTFVEKNKFYFKTFNYYLNVQNLINLNEEEIIMKLDRNCRIITSELKKILKIYQQMNEPYHNDFVALFNNISIISETDFKDYFYARLYNKINIRNKNRMKQNKSTKKENDEYDFNYNDMNSNLIDNCDVISVKSNKSSHYYGKIDKQNYKILKLINDYEKSKIDPPFIKTPSKKKYTLVLDLDETLINVEFKDMSNNKCILHLRPGLFWFLSKVKPFYELITFTSASKEYAQPIINEIELKNKYFDYTFFREHSVISGNDFVKDISRIGRDMKKIIIIDNMEQNFRLNKKNGIKIKAFYGDQNDKVLYELSKILVLIVKQGYEDLTVALQQYANEIKVKITMEN
jgi:Dullard-like phosphatase family protein